MIFGSRLLRSLISPPRRSLPDPPNSGREVRRKALLIGISYLQEEYHSNPQHQLGLGPQRDIDGIRALLQDEFKFKTENITVLTDFPNVPREKWPTKMNIERAIHSFVHGAGAGDIHFIFCNSLSFNAGTGLDVIDIQTLDMGTRYPMLTAMKMTSKTSTSFPATLLALISFEKKMIIDDLLKNILVMPLAAADANLTAVFDCCHSGTVLDLSHYRCNDCTSWTRTACRIYRHIFSKPSVDLTMMVPFTMNMFRPAAAVLLDPYIKDCKGLCLPLKRRGPGCVVCVSACRDKELALGSDRGGSLTRALVRVLRGNTKLTLKELNVSINAEVKIRSKAAEKKRKRKTDAVEGSSKIVQRPQISSLWPLDMNQRLML